MAGESDTFILLILAWLFPPAAAAIVSGCSADLCLNILLTMLGYLPGCLHAFWLVLKRSEANDRYGYKNWTYAGMGEYRPTYGAAPPPVPASQPPPQPQPQPPPPPPAGRQAPVDQKSGYTAPPPPAESKSGGEAVQAPVDQKSAPPPLPPAPDAGQKTSGDAAPSQAPVDQKQADTAVQSTAPASST